LVAALAARLESELASLLLQLVSKESPVFSRKFWCLEEILVFGGNCGVRKEIPVFVKNHNFEHVSD